MTKNRLLNIAINICRFIRFIYLLAFVALTSIFIHFQMDSASYKEVNYNYNTSEFHFIKYSRWKVSGAGEDKEVYALDKITKVSLYIIYLKFVAVLILMFLSIKEFQEVMQSVKSVQTFQKDNTFSFRRIGKYLIVIFLLTSYTSVDYQQGGISGYNISFTTLFLILIAFILAEIFKEGNLLKVENDLTI